MKAAYLFLLMISCAASAPGAARAEAAGLACQQTSPATAPNKLSDRPQNAEHATAPDGDKRQQVRNSASKQRDPRHTPATDRPRDRATVATANRSKQVSNNREHSIPTKVTNRQQPSSAKSETPAKNGFTQDEAARNSQPVRPPTVVRPAASSLNNVRHRGANPAIIGGPGSSNTRNTAVIDGTHMNHRHTGN